ncbi:hypothetical protein F5I97DRAFT_2017911 [Phlebopus sp. FC_14]|nr:hypothetical protein F5I97DRAFT_2017911 [Phlebopus sp. FC_14]
MTLTISASHRVLFTPELLHLIFNTLDKTANTRNACVCKQWFEIALDHIWEKVDGLFHLFRLLKPIQILVFGGSHYDFVCPPEPQDWARFQKYARRVRCLRFRADRTGYNWTLVLDAIARTRTSLDILPNMHTLRWISKDRAHLERCMMFLHARLKHLVVSTHLPAYRSTLFKDISARVPSIHSLNLDISRYDSALETDIRTLLQNLPALRKLTLPEFFLTPPIVEELSRMKHIGVIGLEHTICNEDRIPVTSFHPILAEGAFPALSELALVAHLADVDEFFHSSSAPINIKSLYITTYDHHMPSQIHAFLVTLSQRCQLLSQLFIKLLHKDDTITFDAEQQLSYDTIKPLLSLPNLKKFELIHKYPLKIFLDEVDELARQWPSLESLKLNAEPLFLDPGLIKLDLRALLPFARHCPSLKRLGLYVNATGEEVPITQISEIRPFTSLEVLSVGTSLAQGQEAVAGFLSLLCPPNCELRADVTWTKYGTHEDRFFHPVPKHVIDMRSQAWQATFQLVQPLVQFRKDAKEKSRLPQKEVEDLRIRNSLLTEKLNNVPSSDSCVVA